MLFFQIDNEIKRYLMVGGVNKIYVSFENFDTFEKTDIKVK